jgi:glutamate synthase domain-containing protein 2
MQKGFWKSWIKSEFLLCICTERAQIFEILGLEQTFTSKYSKGHHPELKEIGLMEIRKEVKKDIKAFRI